MKHEPWNRGTVDEYRLYHIEKQNLDLLFFKFKTKKKMYMKIKKKEKQSKLIACNYFSPAFP